MTLAPALNSTHDPALTSWVESANTADTDFPIQNLPFGVFRVGDETPRVGVAIGDAILDVVNSAAALDGADAAVRACGESTLNALMALGSPAWSALRRALQGALAADAPESVRADVRLVPMADATLELPVQIGDYTDFYCSIHHATNVGSLFRPDNPLMPNYKHLPVGYHGRASSIVISGTPVRRPNGQTKAPDAAAPTYGPSRLLDYELEVGFFVGPGNDLGEAVPLDGCEERIFGYCLVNDWSARDIQGWEYQPLGPFLAKSFQTSISPWIVTSEALAPFRVPAFERSSEDPQPLPHLDSERNRALGGVDIHLDVHVSSERMRAEGTAPHRLSRGNFNAMYWTAAQMVTHHCSNGCDLRPGDMLASGTVSGPDKDSRGCLLELTWRGTEPVELANGEVRKFLQDGDELILSGHCQRDGARRIGFGECRGVVLPAHSS